MDDIRIYTTNGQNLVTYLRIHPNRLLDAVTSMEGEVIVSEEMVPVRGCGSWLKVTVSASAVGRLIDSWGPPPAWVYDRLVASVKDQVGTTCRTEDGIGLVPLGDAWDQAVGMPSWMADVAPLYSVEEDLPQAMRDAGWQPYHGPYWCRVPSRA